MRDPRPAVLLLLSLAGVAHAAPAPAWLVARVRLDADLQVAGQLDALSAVAPVIGELSACGLDPRRGLNGVGLAISHAQVTIELEGKLPTTVGGCVGEVMRSHKLLASGTTGTQVSEVEGRVRITAPLKAAVTVDDAPLRVSSTALAGLAMRFGGRSAPRQLDWEVAPDRRSRVQITCADAAEASALDRWLSAAIARAVLDGALQASDLKVELHAKVVTIQLGALEPLRATQVALAVRRSIVEAFKLPSDSMQPTLRAGDHVFVAKGSLTGKAERGDVIVYHGGEGRDFIKRVVAIAGDRVAMDGDTLLVNGKAVPRVRAGEYTYVDSGEEATRPMTLPRWRETIGGRTFDVLAGAAPSIPMSPLTIPAGSVFVLGDNRGNSHDSRFTGPVATSAIVGRVEVIWYSADDDGKPRWDRLGLPVQ